MFRCFVPHHRVDSVCELTPERLDELGLDALLLDVDCTLKRYGTDKLLPEVYEWLDEIRAAGIKICLMSNGLGKRIGRVAAELDVPCVAKALKPLPFGVRRGLKMIDADPKKTAMVGDQLFADIVAGRLAGVTCILVEAIAPEEEPWFTRLKRPLEQMILRWVKPRN